MPVRSLAILWLTIPVWACQEGAQRNAVPFETAGNKIFVQARIDDSPPMRFILDTGAPAIMLDDGRVKALGFQRQNVNGRGGAGESPVAIGRLTPNGCLDVGGTRLAANFMSLDLTAPSKADGMRVDGLIGGDYFKRYIVEIDYQKRIVRSLDPSFDYRGQGIVLPIAIEGGHMYVTAAVENVEGKFLVDTGIRAALILNAPFTGEHQLLSGRPDIPSSTIGIGAGGETRGAVIRLRDFRWGPLHLRDMVGIGSLDRTGAFAAPGLAGMIGAELLRRYKVYIDYPHHRLILERTSQSDELFSYDKSGAFLVSDGPDLSGIAILRVTSGSPAAEAGLSDGDKLVSLDGKKVGLEQARRLFLIERRYDVEVLRGDRPIRAALYTRDITLFPRLPFSPAPGPVKFVFCVACHSTGDKEGIAHGLRGVSARISEREMRAVIMNGRGAMPSFRYRIPAAQIEDIIAYIKSL